MQIFEPFSAFYRRLASAAGPELTQSFIRLGIVGTAMVYFHSDFFAARAASAHHLEWARIAVNSAFAVTVGIAVAVVIRPTPSPIRRIAGMLHDIAAISVAMYLGESASAPVAAIYLWVTLGNGFRYGNRYLYGSTVLAMVGFGTVILLSEYWRQQGSLSFNIMVLLAVIPPYVAALLSSLHKARAELRHQASVDPLTGLLNRAEFDQVVGERLQLSGNGHSLLFCDLDHFKAVNDSAGHAAGDKLLADVGAIVRESVRASDLCGRIGGDEFCVFLEACPLEKAREVAEKIRNGIAGYRLGWGNDYYSVGVSIGVAASDAVKDLPSLVRLADAATYAAKNAGRNQVHVIDPRLDGASTRRLRQLRPGGAANRTRGMRDTAGQR